jgi:hypothetical protein
MGLFFYVPRGKVLPTGTLLEVYSGWSAESLKLNIRRLRSSSEPVIMLWTTVLLSTWLMGKKGTRFAGRPAPMTALTLSTVTSLTTHSTSEWNSSQMSPCWRVIMKPSQTTTLLGKLRVTGPPFAYHFSCLKLVLSCVFLPLTI